MKRPIESFIRRAELSPLLGASQTSKERRVDAKALPPLRADIEMSYAEYLRFQNLIDDSPIPPSKGRREHLFLRCCSVTEAVWRAQRQREWKAGDPSIRAAAILEAILRQKELLKYVSEEARASFQFTLSPDVLQANQKTLASLETQRNEYFFISDHQVQEVWFSQVIRELEMGVFSMGCQNISEAIDSVKRATAIMGELALQIGLFMTLGEADFNVFRKSFGSASGLQSRQFREIEILAGLGDANRSKIFKLHKHWPYDLPRFVLRLDGPNLRSAFLDLLWKNGYPNLAQVDLHNPNALIGSSTPDLAALAESLVQFDQALVNWRLSHLKIYDHNVPDGSGSGGMGRPYLARMAQPGPLADLKVFTR